MILPSTYWMALCYFTYFFCFGVYLPFWGGWLKGEGVSAEEIGLLLGVGLAARFIGSLVIAHHVKDPAKLLNALRVLALLSLIVALGFGLGDHWLWLLVVIVVFNLVFAPLMPLSDGLAATWQRQFPLDYGKVRVWGSIAFVIASAVTGELMTAWGHDAILVTLCVGLLCMLLCLLLRPSILPCHHQSEQQAEPVTPWMTLIREPVVWRFLLCVALLQGAHAAYYSFSVIYWQQAGYSASVIGYLWSLGVVAEIIVFMFSQQWFRRFSARDLMLASAVCGVVRWSLMGATLALPWLIVIQILHCGTFTLCHLAAMRFIASRSGGDILRLQAAYSALAMGGSIAVVTMVAGFLFAHTPQGTFWMMAVLAAPALFLRLPRGTPR